jgi:hypothetical protein
MSSAGPRSRSLTKNAGAEPATVSGMASDAELPVELILDPRPERGAAIRLRHVDHPRVDQVRFRAASLQRDDAGAPSARRCDRRSHATTRGSPLGTRGTCRAGGSRPRGATAGGDRPAARSVARVIDVERRVGAEGRERVGTPEPDVTHERDRDRVGVRVLVVENENVVRKSAFRAPRHHVAQVDPRPVGIGDFGVDEAPESFRVTVRTARSVGEVFLTARSPCSRLRTASRRGSSSAHPPPSRR